MGFLDINAWRRLIDKTEAKYRGRATEIVQLRARKVLDEALKVSPQWSGNYAANWRIESSTRHGGGWLKNFKVDPWTDLEWWDTGTTSVTGAQKSHSAKAGKAKYAGAPEAIEWNKRINYELISYLKWNSKIKLVNTAPVEDFIGAVPLRAVNLIAAPHGVIAHLEMKFPYLKGAAWA